jgi:hypothetical protein
MTSTNSLTVREALAAFHRVHHLDPDATNAASWTCGIGPVTLRLPNFAWRRAAILHHDLHHVLTGYSCTIRGECQMATWEFAAGRFPHPGATLFCLPLVAAGLVWSPGAIWSAFQRGRRGHSLYGVDLTDTFLRSSVTTLHDRAGTPPELSTRAGNIIAFGWLVLKAWLAVTAPIAGLTAFALRVL